MIYNMLQLKAEIKKVTNYIKIVNKVNLIINHI
jgi:hypothetical protein